MIACRPAWYRPMAVYENFHTQLVIWTKIILPICAIALLSTLFMFARGTNDTGDIPFAQIDEIAREQQITAPQFSGVTSDGSIIEITARVAKPDQGNLESITINEPLLNLNATDGTNLSIRAGEGLLDNAARRAELSGLARLDTSSGYSMETGGLIAELDTGNITSTGPLAIRAPFGKIDAGKVSITISPDGLGQQMQFTQGVTMVYDPAEAAKE